MGLVCRIGLSTTLRARLVWSWMHNPESDKTSTVFTRKPGNGTLFTESTMPEPSGQPGAKAQRTRLS